MKFKFSLLILIALSIHVCGQSKNQVSVLYGISTTSVDIHGAIGDYGYSSRSGTLLGFTYTRNLAGPFSLETGLLFANDKIQLNSDLPGIYQGSHFGEVKIVSIPVYAKFTFLKHLYADGGLLYDNETSDPNNSVVGDQTGLGAELGIGGKYSFGPVTLFVNPYWHAYNITRTQNNLVEIGVKFGLGYNF